MAVNIIVLLTACCGSWQVPWLSMHWEGWSRLSRSWGRFKSDRHSSLPIVLYPHQHDNNLAVGLVRSIFRLLPLYEMRVTTEQLSPRLSTVPNSGKRVNAQVACVGAHQQDRAKRLWHLQSSSIGVILTSMLRKFCLDSIQTQMLSLGISSFYIYHGAQTIRNCPNTSIFNGFVS